MRQPRPRRRDIARPLLASDFRSFQHPRQREAVLALVRAIARQAADEAFDRELAGQKTGIKPSDQARENPSNATGKNRRALCALFDRS